jgi:hypothetical protein
VPVDPRRKAATTVQRFGRVAITGGSTLFAGAATDGGSVFILAGGLVIDASKVLTSSAGAGSVGIIAVTAGRLWLVDGAKLLSTVRGSGRADPIIVSGRSILIDGRRHTQSATEIGSIATGSAAAGPVSVSAGDLRILVNGEISSSTGRVGTGGSVTLDVRHALSIDGSGSNLATGIVTQAGEGSGYPLRLRRADPVQWPWLLDLTKLARALAICTTGTSSDRSHRRHSRAGCVHSPMNSVDSVCRAAGVRRYSQAASSS